MANSAPQGWLDRGPGSGLRQSDAVWSGRRDARERTAGSRPVAAKEAEPRVAAAVPTQPSPPKPENMPHSFQNSGCVVHGSLIQGNNQTITLTSPMGQEPPFPTGPSRRPPEPAPEPAADRSVCTDRGQSNGHRVPVSPRDSLASPISPTRVSDPLSEPAQCRQQQLQSAFPRHDPRSDLLQRQAPAEQVPWQQQHQQQHQQHCSYPPVAGSTGSVQGGIAYHHGGAAVECDTMYIPPEGTNVDDVGTSVDPARVLICYCPPAVEQLGCEVCSSDGGHQRDGDRVQKKVLRLADELRDGGVDVHIDQYDRDTDSVDNWTMWLDEQFARSDYVLAVCTRHLFPASRSAPCPPSSGAVHDCFNIQEGRLVSSAGQRDKATVIPILLDGEEATIPLALQGRTMYALNYKFPLGPEAADVYPAFDRLYARLTNQNPCKPPPRGRLRVLPSLED